MERDDEVDLDLDAGAKKLIGSSEPIKKKGKAKTKLKKSKDDGELRPVNKNTSQLPLSMQPPTTDDIAQYEVRINALKNNLSAAKDYKITEHFKAGDILKHKVFGIGFIVAENGLNKIEVLFSQGRKLLAMSAKK
ncbi:MAG: hypothetical protein K2X39_07800 [Silvanigrellaceae bacterium]|nr:hypothetical protein [Silvanigrellaceae bacterium]